MKFKIHVQPNAKKTEAAGYYDENILKIRISSPPVDGAANKEVIKFISKKLKISKSYVKILSGEKGRDKTIEIPVEMSLDEIRQTLER